MAETQKGLDIKSVIAELEKICAEKPGNVIAHHQLGLVYRQAGRLDEAIRELSKAIELDNQSVESLINLGAIYFDKGDVVRHKLVKDIIDAYEKFSDNKNGNS